VAGLHVWFHEGAFINYGEGDIFLAVSRLNKIAHLADINTVHLF